MTLLLQDRSATRPVKPSQCMILNHEHHAKSTPNSEKITASERKATIAIRTGICEELSGAALAGMQISRLTSSAGDRP
jgi:hypothetical protein